MGFIPIKSHHSGGICLELFPSIEQAKPRKLNHHVWFLWFCLLNKVKIEGKAREASYEFGSKTTRHELKCYAGGFFILVWDGCYILIWVTYNLSSLYFPIGTRCVLWPHTSFHVVVITGVAKWCNNQACWLNVLLLVSCISWDVKPFPPRVSVNMFSLVAPDFLENVWTHVMSSVSVGRWFISFRVLVPFRWQIRSFSGGVNWRHKHFPPPKNEDKFLRYFWDQRSDLKKASFLPPEHEGIRLPTTTGLWVLWWANDPFFHHFPH